MYQVEGRNPIKASIKNGNVKRLLVNKQIKNSGKIKEIIRLANQEKIIVEYVSKEYLDRESKTGRHQGVLGYLEKNSYTSLESILSKEKCDLCLVILDKVQDPQNLGSILRTGAAAGVDAVIVPHKNSVGLTPTVRRVAMGGDTTVPIVQGSLFRMVKTLKDEGFKLIAVDSTAHIDLYDERLTGAVAFILGGEHHGLSEQILDKCDSIVRIPMSSKISSLNVGVATALVLYERVRQQRKI